MFYTTFFNSELGLLFTNWLLKDVTSLKSMELLFPFKKKKGVYIRCTRCIYRPTPCKVYIYIQGVQGVQGVYIKKRYFIIVTFWKNVAFVSFENLV